MDMVVPRQVAAGVPDIPQKRVEQHQCCFEHVEEPLVPQEWAQGLERFGIIKVHRHIPRVLNQTVDAANQNQGHADVQGRERSRDSPWAYLSSKTSPVKDSSKEAEHQDNDKL